MARVLEELIREQLSALETAEGEPYRTASNRIMMLVQDLAIYPSTNTLALLRECAMIRDDLSRAPITFISLAQIMAAKTYATVAGVESIPFLREAIEKGYINRPSDISEITALLKEMEAKKTENGEVTQNKTLEKSDIPVVPPPKTVVPEKSETETVEQKSSHLWLWGIGVIIIVVGGVVVWRAIHGKKSA